MNDTIAREIQAEQNHGREKYGNGPDDLSHDDRTEDAIWHDCIDDHNRRAELSTPMDRRQHLVKLAGLAVSAIEAFDRKRAQTAHDAAVRHLQTCDCCGDVNGLSKAIFSGSQVLCLKCASLTE